MYFDERVHTEFVFGNRAQLAQFVEVESGNDEQNGAGTRGSRFVNLMTVYGEVFAKQWNRNSSRNVAEIMRSTPCSMPSGLRARFRALHVRLRCEWFHERVPRQRPVRDLTR